MVHFKNTFSGLLSVVTSVQRIINRFSTSTLHMSNVQLSVTPNEALVDEKVHIRVDGLPKNGPITIKASLQEGSLRFSSYGCYTATDEGSVVIGEQKSQLGTYTGVYKFVFCPYQMNFKRG